MKKADPRLLLVVAMTVFGTLGLFVRNIPVSSGELALYRAVLAALLIGVYLLVSRQKIPFARIKKEVPLLLLSGAAMGVNWILLFEAYRYTSVSVATLSYYFAPVIVTLVCPILFHEKLTGKKFLCFVMSTLGLVLITDKLVAKCSAVVFEYKLTRKRPLIVEMPDRHSDSNPGDSIKRYISEVVGVKI